MPHLNMTSPIYDFLLQYARRGDLRFHMPGHKGKGFGGLLGTAYPLDITEICGADSLYEANGIIAQAEQNAAHLFGAGATVFSAGGATLCIQAMLAQMKREGRGILAGRGAHRTFLNACILLDLPITWLYPPDDRLLSGQVDPAALRIALKRHVGPACVYLTSPDYLGGMVQLPEIVSICAEFGARLIVDNAHGAHLAFGAENRHPMALGADFCCDSYHKLLPALTGAACVHCRDAADGAAIRAAMAMFGSTSPSYLILASMDLCGRYLETQVRHDMFSVANRIARLRLHIGDRYVLHGGEMEQDIFHLTIHAAESGMHGNAFAAWLQQNGIMYEYADCDCVVLLCSPHTPLSDLDRLEQLLLTCPLVGTQPMAAPVLRVPHLTAAMPLRRAAFAPTEEVPISACMGRIYAMTQPPCPPAVPLAICGEVLDANAAALFQHYGIEKVAVVHPSAL